MKAGTTNPAPTRCAACGADRYSCGIKAGLSGRRCCGDCTHQPDGKTP